MKNKQLYKSVMVAFKGLLGMLKRERNFQIEIGALVINLFLIVYLQLTPIDSAIILLTCSLILAAEIFNTAIEKICDYLQPNYDDRIKTIKDISASAVLLLSICSLLVGVLVYRGYIYSLFT